MDHPRLHGIWVHQRKLGLLGRRMGRAWIVPVGRARGGLGQRWQRLLRKNKNEVSGEKKIK